MKAQEGKGGRRKGGGEREKGMERVIDTGTSFSPLRALVYR